MSDEVQLETTLHQLDLLEAEVYSHYDIRADPIATCINGNRDVMTRKLAFRLIVGKQLVNDKELDARYYALLQESRPDDLIPVIYLRKYYHEGLLRCVLDLTNNRPQEVTEKNSISTLVNSNFEAETRDGFVMVDFMTHWCVPCKKMAADLEKLARHYHGELKIGRLDVDRNMATAQKFGVKTFPTLIILKNGKEVGRLERSCSYPDLQGWSQGALQGENSPPNCHD